MRVPLASTGLRSEDIEAAIEVLQSGNLTMGKKVSEFEKIMAGYLGVEHFVMMNSGSSANLAIFEAMLRPSRGEPLLRRGDGVLVPAIAWPTTIWPVVQLGLVPIFVDVNRDTLALDLTAAAEAISNAKCPVRAIFPIHPLGRALTSSEFENFASDNDLTYISDVCESLGSFESGNHAGVTGLAGSFSFYFSHHITTMEGGGVATNNLAFADDLRSIRSHGWSRDRSDVSEWTHDVSGTDAKFLFVTTGYNVRPMEIQAAIGINQIRDINDFVARRRNIALRVIDALSAGSELNVVGVNSNELSYESSANSWMLIPIRVCGENSKSRKKKILEDLESRGIETRPVLTGNFLSQPAMNRIDGNHLPASNFPIATEITETCFLVGAHHDLSPEQIDHLCASLLEVQL
jgi:CDP-4-dehydro-6-deoxyglucose reductase, E1